MRALAIMCAGLLAACNNSNDGFVAVDPVVPDPIVPIDSVFGSIVGEPVAVISATRGGVPSEFTVTFNNAEGTNITLTTTEGVDIVFDLSDPDAWDIRPDGPIPGFTSVKSDSGAVLEVALGAIQIPNDMEGTDNQVVLAAARLDENGDGFETYMVTGDLTEALPKDDDGLVKGTAAYVGGFAATIFDEGKSFNDTGLATVELDFAAGNADLMLTSDHVTMTGLGVDIDFDSGVSYSGVLSGKVMEELGMTGTFEGAIFGPGGGVTPEEIALTTATAGVFEADGGTIEIVGAYAGAGVVSPGN